VIDDSGSPDRVYFSHLQKTEASWILPFKTQMNESTQRAHKFLARCFSDEELGFLMTQPAFIQATSKIEELDDAVVALALGEDLIRQKWPFRVLSERVSLSTRLTI
jgi:hypothetical protein